MFNFGPLAAEYDPRILEYFEQTNQIKKILSSPKEHKHFIFIARPGGGKTALVKWLVEGSNKDIVVSINYREIRFQLENDNDSTSADVNLFITNELFTKIIQEAQERFNLSEILHNDCLHYLD